MKNTNKHFKREEYEYRANQYLKAIESRYFFDEASRIYKQKTAEAGGISQERQPGHDRHLPFWAVVKRDWLVVSVSVLTLFLLVATVVFARLQWLAIDRQFPEIKSLLTPRKMPREQRVKRLRYLGVP